MHVGRTLIGWLIAVLLVAGCGGAATGPDEDTGAAADTSGSDVIADDSTIADTDISVDTTPTGELVIGTNVTGANDPTSFSALSEGAELEVQLGFQGLWMVVLAFKTRGVFTGELFLSAELKAAGTSQGTLSLAQQKTSAGGDGWFYYYNFFLVVSDPTVGGQPGEIHFLARDDHGHEHQLVRGVMLTGGE